MFGDYSRELLRQGIIELKAGNREPARRYLDRALYLSSDGEVIAEAWYWMSQATEDAAEKRTALENCLANDLQHARARRALAILDGRLKPEEIIDPDRLPPLPKAAGDEKTRRFMCPKCGGRMVYAPDGRSLLCEYCRRRQPVGPERSAPEANDFIVAMATRRGHHKPLHEQVVRCEGCGAQFMVPPGGLSFNCAYCGSPHVTEIQRSQGLIAPDGIIPHAFDQRQAADMLAGWLKSTKIEPQRKSDLPRGLYAPIWSFEMSGSIRYTGEILREPGNAYADVPAKKEAVDGRYPVLMSSSVAGSRRPSAPLVRLIEDFNPRLAQAYDAGYLAAWPAELYDISLAEASLQARGDTYARLQRDLPHLLAPIRLLSTSSADLSIENFRLDLMPVWATELFVDGKGGIVLINGQNGKVSGDVFKRSAKATPGITVWLRDLLHD